MAGKFFLSVKALKQGDLKGENARNPAEIPILGFSFEVTTPRDVATGQPTGRRQHNPVSIYKEWGEISVQLFEALASNENLPLVKIQEMRTDSSGKETLYMEIRLSNATITTIQIDLQHGANPSISTDTEVERVEFTYQKIEIENFTSKVVAVDA